MFEESSGDDSVSGPLDNYSALSSSGYVEKVSDNVYRISSESFSRLSLYAEKGGVSGKKTQLDTLIDSDRIQIVYDWVTVPSFVISPVYDNSSPDMYSWDVGFEFNEDTNTIRITEGSMFAANASTPNGDIFCRFTVSYSPLFTDSELYISYLDDGERVSQQLQAYDGTYGFNMTYYQDRDIRLYVKTENLVGSEKEVDLTNAIRVCTILDARFELPSADDTFNGDSVYTLQEKDADATGYSVAGLTIYPDENGEYFLIVRYKARAYPTDEDVTTAVLTRISAVPGMDLNNAIDIPFENQDGNEYASHGDLIKIGPIPETLLDTTRSPMLFPDSRNSGYVIKVYTNNYSYIDRTGYWQQKLIYDPEHEYSWYWVYVSDTPKTQQSEVSQNE